ncbi:MAG: FtsW/RodA/SpoVE family cell cycle protein [Oscillospiraceae bacterium]|nr:FtsW/RodA/SpoVE family cell cycle protein [Oscillospiraceae bacterium]
MKKLSPYIKDFVKRADMVLLILCLISSIFGIIVIASASASLQSPARYLIVQIASLIIGLGFFVLFTVVDIDIIADKWAALIVFEIVLMLLLLTPLGYADNTGNRAWLRFGFVGVQPAEVIKIPFIIILAKQLTYLKNYKSLNSPLSVGQLLLHCIFTIGLIVAISKDMGSALVFLFIFVIVLFVAGLRFYWFIVGIAGIAAVTPFFWTHVLNQRYRDRILAPYDPTIDPKGFDIRWQVNQSKTALASGQLTGSGLFNGRQTQSGVLPEKQTDFIFSVIGEELGMVACIVVILLLLSIIFRCIYVGIKSHNTMSMLICFGVAAWLIFQTFENIGMCIGIAPVIGLTLPFFSYGGSSLFSMFAAMGVVSGIKYRPKPERFRSLSL